MVVISKNNFWRDYEAVYKTIITEKCSGKRQVLEGEDGACKKGGYSIPVGRIE